MRLLGSRKGTLRELASLEPQIRHLTDSLLQCAGGLQLLPGNATKWLRFARLVEANASGAARSSAEDSDACRDRSSLDGSTHRESVGSSQRGPLRRPVHSTSHIRRRRVPHGPRSSRQRGDHMPVPAPGTR